MVNPRWISIYYVSAQCAAISPPFICKNIFQFSTNYYRSVIRNLTKTLFVKLYYPETHLKNQKLIDRLLRPRFMYKIKEICDIPFFFSIKNSYFCFCKVFEQGRSVPVSGSKVHFPFFIRIIFYIARKRI